MPRYRSDSGASPYQDFIESRGIEKDYEGQPELLSEEQTLWPPLPELTESQVQKLDAIRLALTRATKAQREAFQLVGIERMAWSAAAYRLGVSKATIQHRIEGLRKKVYKILREKGHTTSL